MPLSKTRNRERMRKSRLHGRLLPLTESKPVLPNITKALESMVMPNYKDRFHRGGIDADGNPIYEE